MEWVLLLSGVNGFLDETNPDADQNTPVTETKPPKWIKHNNCTLINR